MGGALDYSMCLYNAETAKPWPLPKYEELVSDLCPSACAYVASSKCHYMLNTRQYERDNQPDPKVAGIVIMIILAVAIIVMYQFIGPIATGEKSGDWTLQFDEH